MLNELVLWVTVGLLLNVAGYGVDTWQFWCFLGTYWAATHLGRQRGRVEGMIDYLEMTDIEQLKIKQILAKIKEEQQ